MNILVTGGASGLGEAILTRLAQDKNNLIYFTFYKSAKNAHKIQRKFKNTSGISCNFYESRDLVNLLDKMSKLNLDVLVNNAIVGIRLEAFHKQEAGEILKGFETNVLPVIQITRQAISTFKKKRFGKIITILTSYLVSNPPIGLSQYVAQKAYLSSMSKSWAVEYAKFNITSNCISPSPMNTELQKNVDRRIIEQMILNHPLKRLLKVDEVAEAVSFYVNCSQQINGNNLIINSAENVI